MTIAKISSFSGSVVSGDWGPALLAAWATISANGGTIEIDTDVWLKTTSNFGAPFVSLKIVGTGGEIKIGDGSGSGIVPFQSGGLNRIKFEDLTFRGNVAVAGVADCYRMTSMSAELTTFENCIFAGVWATQSILFGVGDLVVKQSKMGGCSAPDGLIYTDSGRGLTVHDSQFYDYQYHRGVYYDRGAYRGTWIGAAATGAVANGANKEVIDIRNCRFDEGSAGSVVVNGIGQVNIENCRSNLGGGIYLTNVANARVFNYHAGYGDLDRTSVSATTCGDVLIDGLTVDAGPHKVVIDATSRVKILNSPTATVQVAAGAAYELNGVKYRGTIAQVGG